jgi:hypothetical protein
MARNWIRAHRVNLNCLNCDKFFSRPIHNIDGQINFCTPKCSRDWKKRNSAAYKSGRIKVYFKNVRVIDCGFSKRKVLIDKLKQYAIDYPGSEVLISFNEI